MRKRIASTAGAAALAIGLAGGVAYAAVQSVSTTPDSQIVIPPRPSHSPSNGHGADDPATHDANDANDANDDHGGTHDSHGRGGGHGADDHGGHGGDD